MEVFYAQQQTPDQKSCWAKRITLLSSKYTKHQNMQTKWIKSLELCFFQVRREKISERMKYLQDLVPGCSKVRKASLLLSFSTDSCSVMCDEVVFISWPELDYLMQFLDCSPNVYRLQGRPSCWTRLSITCNHYSAKSRCLLHRLPRNSAFFALALYQIVEVNLLSTLLFTDRTQFLDHCWTWMCCRAVLIDEAGCRQPSLRFQHRQSPQQSRGSSFLPTLLFPLVDSRSLFGHRVPMWNGALRNGGTYMLEKQEIVDCIHTHI